MVSSLFVCLPPRFTPFAAQQHRGKWFIRVYLGRLLRECTSWKNKTGKTNDRLYGTENIVALIWVQEMEGGSWAASHRPHHSKNQTQKSIGEQHRSRELNVGQTNPDEPEEIFYGTRQHFVLYPSHPTRRLFTASKYGKRRRVSHTLKTQPPTSRGTIGTGPCRVC